MVRYKDRPLDTQIRIDNLMGFHNYKYPLSWYEKKTEAELRAMHTAIMVKFAESMGA